MINGSGKPAGRFQFLMVLFCVILGTLVLQKPLFMLYNYAYSDKCCASDYLQVMLHGSKLDATVAGYLLVIPFIVVFISIWVNKIKLRKILTVYYAIIVLLIMIAFVTDTVLYDFWNFKLDATVLFYIDSPSNAMASVSTGFIIARIIVVILLSALLFWVFLKITPQTLSSAKKRILSTITMLLVGAGLFVLIRGGFGASTSNVGRVYFSENQFLNHSAVNPLFSFIYSLGKSEDLSKQFRFFSEEKREEIFNGLYPKDGETVVRLLNTDRPNILIILLESFGGNFIEALGGEPDVTPNFNRLSEEGVFFTQFYSNSFRTDRGIVCTFSGYPAFPTISVMKMPIKSQTLPSVTKCLLKAGYKSDFLYGGDIDFTNMQSYFWSGGYQKITSDKNFTLKERHTHAWGVNDDITFDYLYNTLLLRQDSLWYTGFLTLSSHSPFEVPYHRLEDEILNAFAYTDNCLGKFIDQLKKTPVWNNLLIICLADHGYCYPKNVVTHDPVFFHTPMLWLGGAVDRPLKVEKIVNQTDLAATLLGQLNLPHYDFEFSRDVFSNAYNYPFAFFTFNNGFGFRDSTGVSIYDNAPDKVIIEEPLPDESRVEKGKAILQTIYNDLRKR